MKDIIPNITMKELEQILDSNINVTYVAKNITFMLYLYHKRYQKIIRGHNMYNVIFYVDDRGRMPVKESLDELEKKAAKSKQARILYEKIVYYIEIIEKLGTRSGLPYTKHIKNDIWELRPKDYRALMFMWQSNNIVLLHSFMKKTQKTPKSEIERAEKEIIDWKENGHKRL